MDTTGWRPKRRKELGRSRGSTRPPLLRAECAAIAALAYRRLGRTEEAEERRAEAAAGFSALGAVRLLAHFEADWSDGGRSGGGVPPRTP
jgi:hypothetical protein